MDTLVKDVLCNEEDVGVVDSAGDPSGGWYKYKNDCRSKGYRSKKVERAKEMLGSFAALGKQLKVKPAQASIDNIVFKLHYRGTFCILLLATILVCSKEYIGEHIRCIVDNGVPERVINTFCFFTSTFTVVHHYNETMLEQGYIPHPGVGPSIDSDPVKHHAYYQWVPFMLFGQAILFYLPHYLWKKKEGGRVQALVDGLHVASLSFADQDITVNGIVVPSRNTVTEKMTTIKTDFLTRLHATRTWSTWLILSEVLNLVNLILQVHFTNVFLGGHFIDLGVRVAEHDDWDRNMDPLDIVFPKVTKCQFHKYGPSGSIQKHDALCVMALNVINEKIYTFLWFWYLILFILTSLANRPDIVLVDHSKNTTYIVDVTIPHDENLQKAERDKILKYMDLAHEIKDMWRTPATIVVLIVISTNGLIPKNLHANLCKVGVDGGLKYLMQKAVLLSTCRTLPLIWRLFTFIFHARSARFNEYVFATANPGKLDIKNVTSVTRECYFADWLFLYYLAKNMDGFVFKNLFMSLAEEMDRHTYIGNRSPAYSEGDTPAKRKDSSSPSSLFDDGTLKLLSDDDDKADSLPEKKPL